jgi:hypothetical protein
MNIKAFKLNEVDTIAAPTLQEAKDWYLDNSGFTEEEAFEDIHEVNLDTKIWDNERMTKKISIREAISRYWKGKPFIVSTGGVVL